VRRPVWQIYSKRPDAPALSVSPEPRLAFTPASPHRAPGPTSFGLDEHVDGRPKGASQHSSSVAGTTFSLPIVI